MKQFFLSLPDLYSVVSNILGLVSPESYRVSYPVTDGLLCAAASSCYSKYSILSVGCCNVVGVTVLSKVSPTATSYKPSGVCKSESRNLSV